MKASAQPAGDSSGRFTLVELEDCYEGRSPSSVAIAQGGAFLLN